MSSLRDLSRRAVLARALATVAVASACGPAAPVPETVAPLGDEPAMAQEVPFEQGPGEALPPDDVGCDEGMTYDDESAGYDETAAYDDEAAFQAAYEFEQIPDTPIPAGAPDSWEEAQAAIRALAPVPGTPEPSQPDGLPLRQAVRGPHRAQVELIRELEPEDEGQPRVVAYTWNEMDEWLGRQHETADGVIWDARIDEQRRKCEWREREEQRRSEADPEWHPDYDDMFYTYGDSRVCGQVEAVPPGMGRMPLCDRLMLAVLEPAPSGWRVIRRQGPFGEDQCHRGIRKFAWRDLDGDGTKEIVLETQHGGIGVYEIGEDWFDWSTSLHVIWPDHTFDLPLGTHTIEDCTNRRGARYEFRRDGSVLHVERADYSTSASCTKEPDAWPTGEDAETLRDVETTDLRWDPARRTWEAP